ncbi:hypothetical protein GCM10009641_36780 [Mycobacterium cookii]|uniref:Uncharacterized protein n=1 Tax=Nocardioides furvisabuli TaxID=375542 RepID=A0ABP5IPL6_9ACTN
MRPSSSSGGRIAVWSDIGSTGAGAGAGIGAGTACRGAPHDPQKRWSPAGAPHCPQNFAICVSHIPGSAPLLVAHRSNGSACSRGSF